jgi:SH3 domain-containing protein
MKRLTLSLIAILLTAGTAYAQTSGTVRVTAARANVRSAPNQKSSILARVPVGTVLQLQAVQGDWYRVQLPGSGSSRAAKSNAFISKKVSTMVGKATKTAPASAGVAAAPTPSGPAALPPATASVPPALPAPVPVTEPISKSIPVPAEPAMAPVSRDGASVALQKSNGVTFMGSSSARVTRMLERPESVPEFVKAVVNEGSGVAATGSTPVTYVWTIDAGSGRPVDDARPTFAVMYKDIPGVSPDDVIPVIVRLLPTASGGRFVGALRGRADEAARPGAEWDVMKQWKQEVVKTSVEVVGRGAARITPSADLAPGDYAVVLRLKERKKLPGSTVLSQTGEGRLFAAAWPFSVN